MEEILTGVSFGQELKEGAEAFAKEDGNVSLEINGPPSTEPEVAQKQATDMLAKKPEAFGFAPFPPELWTRTAATINEQVAPNVLTFNERPASEKDQVSAAPNQTFVGVNDREGAKLMLEELIKTRKTAEVLVAAKSSSASASPRKPACSRSGPKGSRKRWKPGSRTPRSKNSTRKSNRRRTPKRGRRSLPPTRTSNIATGTCNQDGESLIKLKKEKGYKYMLGTMELVPLTQRRARRRCGHR